MTSSVNNEKDTLMSYGTFKSLGDFLDYATNFCHLDLESPSIIQQVGEVTQLVQE